MKKKSWIAGLLSYLFPGLGHLYAGKIQRGFIMFFLWVILAFVIAFISSYLKYELIIPALFLIPNIVSILILIDAIKCVKKENETHSGIMKSKAVTYITYGFIYLIFVPFVLVGLIKSTVAEAYRIPTGSMENTLLIGDYILGVKNAYGIHIPFSDKYLFYSGKPERNDLVIYKFNDLTESGGYEKNYYIKRCIGLPGEEIKIVNKKVYINNTEIEKTGDVVHSIDTMAAGAASRLIFPVSSGWNEDNYGPLKIPAAGEEVKINFDNLQMWEKIIKDEGNTLSFDGSGKITLNGTTAEEFVYKVKNDYFFLMGDNRGNSLDSRYKGFICVGDIVGKAKLVYFSSDKGNIRFDRIGRGL